MKNSKFVHITITYFWSDYPKFFANILEQIQSAFPIDSTLLADVKNSDN